MRKSNANFWVGLGAIASLTLLLSAPTMQSNEAAVTAPDSSAIVQQFQKLQVLSNLQSANTDKSNCECGESCNCKLGTDCDCKPADTIPSEIKLEGIALNEPLRESDFKKLSSVETLNLVQIAQQGVADNNGPPKPAPPAPEQAPQQQTVNYIPAGAMSCASCASGFYYPNTNRQQPYGWYGTNGQYYANGGWFQNRPHRLRKLLPRNWGSGRGC